MTDFTIVTEAAGDALGRDVFDMFCTRYIFALERCRWRDVLEVVYCPVEGVALLARTAVRVGGCDYAEGLLGFARQHYGVRIRLVRLDRQELPFGPDPAMRISA